MIVMVRVTLASLQDSAMALGLEHVAPLLQVSERVVVVGGESAGCEL